MMIGSLIAVFIMDKIGDIWTMALGAALSIPFILSCLIPAYRNYNQTSTSFVYNQYFVYVVVLFFSVFNGMGTGLAQTANGKYIGDCATENNKGFFYSYAWAFFMGS